MRNFISFICSSVSLFRIYTKRCEMLAKNSGDRDSQRHFPTTVPFYSFPAMRSRWLMLPNKLSRKTCRSQGALRPLGAPFISLGRATLISLERRSAPYRRRCCCCCCYCCRCHHPPSLFYRATLYIQPSCIHACIHTLRRWYPSNPIYFDFAINVCAPTHSG